MSTATIEPRTQAAPRGPGPQPGAAPAPNGAGRPPGGETARRRRPPARALVLLGLLGGLSGFVLYRFEATPATGPARIALRGNIDVRQVNLSFKVGGRIDRLPVDEGDAVASGQLVAALDERVLPGRAPARPLGPRRSGGDARPARARLAARGDRPGPGPGRRARGLRGERRGRAPPLGQPPGPERRLAPGLRRGGGDGQGRLGPTRLGPRGPPPGRDRPARRGHRRRPGRPLRGGGRAHPGPAPAGGRPARRARGRRHPHPRTREVGAIVQPGETAFTLTLSSPVWVRTYVDEADLGDVRPGMAVSVVTDTPGARAYAGRVGFISPTAEFTPKTVETRELRTALVYRLRVVVDDPDGGLRQGMPVGVAVDLPGPRPRSFRERLVEGPVARPAGPRLVGRGEVTRGPRAARRARPRHEVASRAAGPRPWTPSRPGSRAAR